MYEINIKENGSVNQEWTIQRHWLQGHNKTHDEDKQNKNAQHHTQNM